MVNSISCNLALAGRGRMPFDRLKRREFITLLGGAAAAWPLAARAQQPTMPVIGSHTGHSRISFAAYLSAFQRGLADMGYVEGRNLAIEYRFAEGRYDRMPEMAADLVRRPIAAMLLTGGGAQPVLTSGVLTTIPVVFVTGTDPVRGGIVQSLNRPGGNVTGVYQFAAAMDAKRLGMLREIVPSARDIGVLVNPTYADVETQLKEVGQAASTLGSRRTSCVPARRARSTQPWRPSPRCEPGRCWSAPILSSTPGVAKSWRWRRAMPFRRSTSSANLPR